MISPKTGIFPVRAAALAVCALIAPASYFLFSRLDGSAVIKALLRE